MDCLILMCIGLPSDSFCSKTKTSRQGLMHNGWPNI